MKFSLFERFGVLPAAGDRHLVEFFPGFLTEESGWGRRWGVGLTSIADREAWQDYYKAEFAELRAATEVPKLPSGEIVAPLIDAFLRDKTRHFPLNLPNTGQCPDLPEGPVVESMVTADGDGLHGRDAATAPPVLAEWLRRIGASQEATVEAALTGDREKVVEAMLLDPLAGRTDFDHLVQMTDELIDADQTVASAVRVSGTNRSRAIGSTSASTTTAGSSPRPRPPTRSSRSAARSTRAARRTSCSPPATRSSTSSPSSSRRAPTSTGSA